MQIRPRAWWDAAWPLVDRMFGTPRQDADTVQARLRTPLDDALLARWNTDRTRAGAAAMIAAMDAIRSEEHTSELQSLMRISYAVFCLKKKNYTTNKHKLISCNQASPNSSIHMNIPIKHTPIKI